MHLLVVGNWKRRTVMSIFSSQQQYLILVFIYLDIYTNSLSKTPRKTVLRFYIL